jgi:carbon storage regulator CsrA
MLVLTRKIQEQIQIGDNVTITILKVKGRTVRLGIEAPQQVKVVRGELPPQPAARAAPVVSVADSQEPLRNPTASWQASRDKKTDRHDASDKAEFAHRGHRPIFRSPLASMVRDTMRGGPMSAVAD